MHLPNLASRIAILGFLVLALAGCTDTTTVAWPDDAILSGVSPASGPTQGGAQVTVFGFGFRDGASVFFNGLPASQVTFVSASQMTCVTPPSAAAGFVDVAVENHGGRTSTLGGGYEYTSWLDVSWLRRAPLTLSGSLDLLTAFQVKVDLAYDTDMQPDFGDIRFSWSDATAESAIPFWVESVVTGTNATVWVRVPSIPTTGTTIYVYYGNPATSSASSFDQTFDKDDGALDLVGRWHLDEGAGFGTDDDSGLGNHAVLHNFSSPAGWLGLDGGTWADRADVRFSQGNCLLFDGLDDRLDAGPDPSLNPATAVSVEAWVRASKSSAFGAEQVIAGRWRTFGAGFTDTAQWKAFDPGREGFDAQGFDPDGLHGAAFDGRYIYLVQYYTGGTQGGEVLRYDTHADFGSIGSYRIYDPGDNGVGTDPDGFTGASFDGRYVYFIPHADGPASYAGEVMRYDTTAPFEQVTSWETMDIQAPSSPPWSSLADMPTTPAYTRAVALNGLIHVIGGIGPVADNTEYDPVNDVWNARTPMGTARQTPNVAVLGGKIYVTGGIDNVPVTVATMEVYDPGADTWTPGTSMNTQRYGACALSLGGKLYVMGGHDGTSALATCEAYDPTTTTWSAIASMPTARAYASAVVRGDRIYVIGGSPYTSAVESYHPVTDAWTSHAAMPVPRHGLVCSIINDRIYAMGGWNGVSYQSRNDVYDPTRDTWTTKTAMTGVREHMASATLNGKIYVFGGSDGLVNLATAESYDPSVESPFQIGCGYEGSVFDGRYLYLVPYYCGYRHGEVARFDTQGDFNSFASWSAFSAKQHGVGTNPVGFFCGIFDGTYVYFTPYAVAGGVHTGEVLRYDTRKDFMSASSWTTFDAGTEGLDAQGYIADGYVGATFDGRYIYFSPHHNGSAHHGEVLRYDTHADFHTLSSWKAYDPGANGVGTDPVGYRSAHFDGRYVIFEQYYNGTTYSDETLRYDTTEPFDSASSWSTFRPYAALTDNYENGGNIGMISDGRFVYLVPHHDSGGHHGEIMRYDTTAGEGAYKLLWSATAQNGSHAAGPFGAGAVLATDGGVFSVYADTVHEPGVWHHMAMTYDGTALALYMDGALVRSTPASGAIAASAAPFRIGANGDGRGTFAGSVDEVRVYDRGLSADEVLAHSQRRKYASPAPAVTAQGDEERR